MSVFCLYSQNTVVNSQFTICRNIYRYSDVRYNNVAFYKVSYHKGKPRYIGRITTCPCDTVYRTLFFSVLQNTVVNTIIGCYIFVSLIIYSYTVYLMVKRTVNLRLDFLHTSSPPNALLD